MKLMWGAAAVGVLLGVLSVPLVLNSGASLGRKHTQGWLYSNEVGSRAAGPYLRAIIAKSGLLALNRDETIYFQRDEDEHGRRLREACDYQLSGGPLPARWWSVTIYGADDFLPVNGDDAEAMDATRVARTPDGRWSMIVSRARPRLGDWLSSRNAKTVSLTLRLYNPQPHAVADQSAVALPTIRTLACHGDAA